MSTRQPINAASAKRECHLLTLAVTAMVAGAGANVGLHAVTESPNLPLLKVFF